MKKTNPSCGKRVKRTLGKSLVLFGSYFFNKPLYQRLILPPKPTTRGLALILQGQAVNLSYMYDGLTIYPQSPAEIINVKSCIKKCQQLQFVVLNQSIATKLVRFLSAKSKDWDNDYEKCIFREDDAHDFYHQDEFNFKQNHYHIKFRFIITPEQFSQIIHILVEEKLISIEEERVYTGFFRERNEAARAALDAVCVGESKEDSVLSRQHDEQALLQFISACWNNDLLVYLHQYLLEQKFAYLRTITEDDRHPKPGKEWCGTDPNEQLVPTSGTWAKLEKAISLQMIQNLRNQVGKFTPQLGAERTQQLVHSHRFFRIKRSRLVADPNAKRTFKTIEAFERADTETLDRKYHRIFGNR